MIKSSTSHRTRLRVSHFSIPQPLTSASLQAPQLEPQNPLHLLGRHDSIDPQVCGYPTDRQTDTVTKKRTHD